MKRRASEIEWLYWFYQHVNLGPAYDDVMDGLKKEFCERNDCLLPKLYDLDICETCEEEMRFCRC